MEQVLYELGEGRASLLSASVEGCGRITEQLVSFPALQCSTKSLCWLTALILEVRESQKAKLILPLALLTISERKAEL